MSDRPVLKEKNNSNNNRNAAEAHHHHHKKQHQQEKKEKSSSNKSTENLLTDTFFKRYKVIEKIGEGSYSEVLKCQNRFDQTTVACKRLKHIYKSWNDLGNISEVATLRAIEKHPNILQMLEIHYDETVGKVSLVFELMDVNLYELIKDRRKLLGESRVRNFMVQLFRALRHLHRLGIFHRDIKPENILIRTKNDHLKLGDLGSVRGMFSKAPYTEYISTRWYRSPECLLTAGHYSHKMDVWAAGCVFYEVLTLRPLFPGSSELDQINRINNILGPPPMKLLDVFHKQSIMERDSYRNTNQLNRRQNIQKLLDGYSSRYIMVNDSQNSTNKSIKSRNRNVVEYHFAGREGTGLDKLLSNAISHEAREIIKGCLQYDPELRPTAHKILHFSYFSDMKKDEPSIKLEKGSNRPVITICGESAIEHCESIDLRTLGDNKTRHRRAHPMKLAKQPSKQTVNVKKPDVNNNYLKNTTSSGNKITSSGGSGSKNASNTNLISHKATRKSSIASVTNIKDRPVVVNKAQVQQQSGGRAGGRIGHNTIEPELTKTIQTKSKPSQSSFVIHHQKKAVVADGKQVSKKEMMSSSSTSFESIRPLDAYKYKAAQQHSQTKLLEKSNTGASKEVNLKSNLAMPFADITLSPYIKAPSELRFLQKKIKGDQQQQPSLGRNKPIAASTQNLSISTTTIPHNNNAETQKMSSVVAPSRATTIAGAKYAKSSNAASNAAQQLRQVLVDDISSPCETYSAPDDDTNTTSYATASSVKIGQLVFTNKQQQESTKVKGKESPSPSQNQQRSRIPLLLDDSTRVKYKSDRGGNQKDPYKITKLVTSPQDRRHGGGPAAAGATEKWRNRGIPRRIAQSPDRERDHSIRLLRKQLFLGKDKAVQFQKEKEDMLNNNLAPSSTNASFLSRATPEINKIMKKNGYDYSSQETMGKHSTQTQRFTDGTPYSSSGKGGGGRYNKNSTTDYENLDIQESSSIDSRNIIYNPGGAIVTRVGKMKILTEDATKKPTIKKKGVNDLYPPEIIFSSRYRAAPDSLKSSSNYIKHQQQDKTQLDVKEKLNNKIEQRRRQQANSNVGDHPSKLMSERSSSFLSPGDFKRQYSTTMMMGGRMEEQQQYARPTIQNKLTKVERRPPIPPGKVLGLHSTSENVRGRVAAKLTSPNRNNEVVVGKSSSYRHSNSNSGRIAIAMMSTNNSNSRTLEKNLGAAGGTGNASGVAKNHPGRRENAAADKIRKEFRDSQRKRSERIKKSIRDEVFCSSDDDVVISMRKKFDSLISERARKLSESLKSNLVSNVGSNDYRNKVCADSDDNLLSPAMMSASRAARNNASSNAEKAKKYARRELRARMAESLTMSNRFASMHWRLPDNLQHHQERSLQQSRSCLNNKESADRVLVQAKSSYNDSIIGANKSKYAHAKEQMHYHHHNNHNDYIAKNNLNKYQAQQQQTRHTSETSRIYPFSRHEQNKNRSGQIYTPPGNKPVYQSPQAGGGTLLNERKLRYSHNIAVPKFPTNSSNNNNNGHSNYSQRGRNIKEFTDMKSRQR